MKSEVLCMNAKVGFALLLAAGALAVGLTLLAYTPMPI